MNSRVSFRLLLLAAALLPGARALRAWDYEGHRIVNQLALASLPAEFPAWVREPASAERIAFLSGEPDRWRNMPDLPLRHVNNPNHYLDLEQLTWAGLDPATVSPLRYVFATQFAAARAAHTEHFPPIDPAKNAEHLREWPGFLPWQVTECFDLLKSEFSYLRAFEEAGGTPEEIANAKANILYTMGVMGHYVGDGAQPLHDTVHHNGWVGANPNGYTKDPGFHQWIDGGFINAIGLRFADLQPRARPARVLAAAHAGEVEAMFPQVMAYVLAQNQRVEPLYQLEKAGKLRADGTPGSAEGRAFIEEQLLRGGEMLGSLWLTAWQTATPDQYLLRQLAKRAGAHAPAK